MDRPPWRRLKARGLGTTITGYEMRTGRAFRPDYVGLEAAFAADYGDFPG